jgi:hypothetical protein
VQAAVWEGIGLGWWYSELGGGETVRPATSGVRTDLSVDNTNSGETPVTTDQVVWAGSKIPSVFNGNFEEGNMRGGLLSPLQELIRGDSAPGWSLHQKDDNDPTPANIVSYQLDGTNVLGHAAELSSDGDTELVHNRFYIPTNAQFVQFQYNVREVEWGRDINNQLVVRQPDLNVYVRDDRAFHREALVNAHNTATLARRFCELAADVVAQYISGSEGLTRRSW